MSDFKAKMHRRDLLDQCQTASYARLIYLTLFARGSSDAASRCHYCINWFISKKVADGRKHGPPSV